jgi:hypothetical protein
MGPDAPVITKAMDELIAEGLIECCDTGGILGHPESNKFYMPTSGYNVWKDDGVDGVYIRHKGRYLHHVRKYLGIDQSKGLFKYEEYYKTEEGQKDYAEWLERNQEPLEIMKTIPDYSK